MRRVVRLLVQVVSVSIATLIAAALVFGLLQFRVVASESMTGTFNRGDVVVILGTALEEPRIGSIAVFNYYNLDRTELIGLFSHRIVGGNAAIGWTTQGDANPDPDSSLVLPQDITGVVVGWVPAVGFLLQPQVLFAILSLTVLAFVIGPELGLSRKGRKS